MARIDDDLLPTTSIAPFQTLGDDSPTQVLDGPPCATLAIHIRLTWEGGGYIIYIILLLYLLYYLNLGFG